MMWERVGVLALLLCCWTVPSTRAAGSLDQFEYAGSERCRECHAEMYDGWKDTFHATVVQDAKKNPSVVLGDFSVPGLGFSLADVEYTIGGHWDQRYMKQIGDEYYVLPKAWSVQSQSWRAYNVWSWRKKPYDRYCKGCHVTAYDPTANVQVAEHRIGCEACHGPGWSHVESGGKGTVVNPKKLSEERGDMICAACHVRGQDPSQQYYFPVGYVPGEDLGKYYAPLDKAPDETNTQAILRNFQKWKEERAQGGKVKCDVCGIPGAAQQDSGKVDEAMEFCFSCHEFKEKYAEHHRHPADTKLVCFDCHVQRTKEVMNPRDQDIHSYGYFLVHADNCYDREIEKTCSRCHEEKGLAWAREVVLRWRGAVHFHED